MEKIKSILGEVDRKIYPGLITDRLRFLRYGLLKLENPPAIGKKKYEELLKEAYANLSAYYVEKRLNMPLNKYEIRRIANQCFE